MQIRDFEWDEGNELKNYSKHGVTSAEAEEAFFNANSYRKIGQRYILYGITDAGKHLAIVFICKPGGKVRVIMAREMDDSEKHRFKKAKKGGGK
ncbi:MAG: BrnT family toxin [Candidatus Eremiobacteraeota bacterium]|nr:BrnT family toxin [Candidatus Eremiobacteraeota bacterium]